MTGITLLMNHALTVMFLLFTILLIIANITIIFAGPCSSWETGDEICQTQGPFRFMYFIGAGTHQVQGCTTCVLSQHCPPRHDSAARNRTMSLRGLA
jgi:hypothetical protein